MHGAVSREEMLQSLIMPLADQEHMYMYVYIYIYTYIFVCRLAWDIRSAPIRCLILMSRLRYLLLLVHVIVDLRGMLTIAPSLAQFMKALQACCSL